MLYVEFLLVGKFFDLLIGIWFFILICGLLLVGGGFGDFSLFVLEMFEYVGFCIFFDIFLLFLEIWREGVIFKIFGDDLEFLDDRSIFFIGWIWVWIIFILVLRGRIGLGLFFFVFISSGLVMIGVIFIIFWGLCLLLFNFFRDFLWFGLKGEDEVGVVVDDIVDVEDIGDDTEFLVFFFGFCFDMVIILKV